MFPINRANLGTLVETHQTKLSRPSGHKPWQERAKTIPWHRAGAALQDSLAEPCGVSVKGAWLTQCKFDTQSRKQWVMNTNWSWCLTQAVRGSQKRKVLHFPDRGLPSFSEGRSSTIKICLSGEERSQPAAQPSATFSVDFLFFLKEELKRPSQSTRCRRQSILMVRLLNTLWIFTVDQQKVMKHRCSCNCDTLGKFILLNEPQLHTSTCVMWKCTVGTRGYNRRYVGMITGWFRTC